MIETKKVRKNLYDLARALSRWEGEGGLNRGKGRTARFTKPKNVFCGVLVLLLFFNGTISLPKFNGTSLTMLHP